MAGKRLRETLLNHVEQQTERVQRAAVSGTLRPNRLRRVVAAAGVERLGDGLIRVAGGDMAYQFGQHAIHHKHYYAAASYFADAERAYAPARNEKPDRLAAARANRAWALANGGRLERAVPILERLVAEMSQVPQTEDTRVLWPGQTVGERRRWLDAQLRWALAQTQPAAANSMPPPDAPESN
jgi:hypothetical protein